MHATMLDFYEDDDAAANVVERRWFAAAAQAKVMQDECDVLREVMDLAEEAWRRSRAQLAELEAREDIRLPIGVRWNPQTKRYQSLDRTYEHFLLEQPMMGGTPKSVLH